MIIFINVVQDKLFILSVMQVIRSSRKNKFKEAAIVSHWHDFNAGQSKIQIIMFLVLVESYFMII